jgi:4-hydroxy-3-methylbut-2-enyl diphosphate reductase
MPQPKAHSAFRSEVLDRLGNSRAWDLPGGTILLPRVFGFCRGVTRALEMLESALDEEASAGRRFFLLGPIIHNPWVNRHFERRGVRILSRPQIEKVADFLGAEDHAVIPAFGATPGIEDQLRRVGCRVIDTTCPDVRRLWAWARRAAQEGYGVLIYGRWDHDETVVTKSHLESVGGQYAVIGDLEEARRFCAIIAEGREALPAAGVFGPGASNAASLEPFLRLAQVSQTTMLYEETALVRDLLNAAYERRFGREEAGRRLLLQPTVCRATQDRQTAARELCEAGCDLIVVVGGFGSSNTRHLYELARRRGPAYFIEDASAILTPAEKLGTDPSFRRENWGLSLVSPNASVIRSLEAASDSVVEIHGWLPQRRPLRVGVLAGASSPEAVVGQVLQRLAELLSK